MNVVMMNSSQDSLTRVASDRRIQRSVSTVSTHQPTANPRNGQQIKDLHYCEHTVFEFCVTSGSDLVLINLLPMTLLTARFLVRCPFQDAVSNAG
jgi:hypothetical protein